MKNPLMAYVLLRLCGLAITIGSIAFLMVLADAQRLSYLTIALFTHLDMVKSITIISIFTGIFFLFYSSPKAPDRTLNVKLFKGSMKMHPDLIKQTLENWFKENQLHGLKLLSVNVNPDNKIDLELKTSNLEEALVSLEDVESKLKDYMRQNMGIHDPIDVQLYEV